MRTKGEFQLIADCFAPLAAGAPGAFGLTDDAAVLDCAAGRQWVITTDAMVEGVHFLPDTDPQRLAAKLLAVNLSDLAAMGARPEHYTIAAALPSSLDDPWLEAFAKGLGETQERFGIHLVGGDTVSTPGPLTLTLTAIGSVVEGRALTRGGSKPGDRIWVSGTIGDAALGLLVAQGKLAPVTAKGGEYLVGRYETPTPRTELGRQLADGELASAAVDVSDGLLADLAHICEVSGVSAELSAADVPFSDAARRALEAAGQGTERLLTGGDDYELLFTAPPELSQTLAGLANAMELPLTTIGAITPARTDESAPVRVLDAGGQPVEVQQYGFRHF